MACAYNLGIWNAKAGSYVLKVDLCDIVSFRTAKATFCLIKQNNLKNNKNEKNTIMNKGKC